MNEQPNEMAEVVEIEQDEVEVVAEDGGYWQARAAQLGLTFGD